MPATAHQPRTPHRMMALAAADRLAPLLVAYTVAGLKRGTRVVYYKRLPLNHAGRIESRPHPGIAGS